MFAFAFFCIFLFMIPQFQPLISTKIDHGAKCILVGTEVFLVCNIPVFLCFLIYLCHFFITPTNTSWYSFIKVFLTSLLLLFLCITMKNFSIKMFDSVLHEYLTCNCTSSLVCICLQAGVIFEKITIQKFKFFQPNENQSQIMGQHGRDSLFMITMATSQK